MYVLLGKHEGVGLKPEEDGLILLFLRCNSTLRKPAMTGVEEEGDGGIG
jgi:hypothetical protein